MSATIKIKTTLSGDVAEVKTLILHPMETGLRKDPDTDELVPMHHITRLVFSNNDRTVMVANFSTAVSKNPYFSFSFSGASSGDALVVTWVDNRGATDRLETVL